MEEERALGQLTPSACRMARAFERCVGTAGGSVTRMRRDWSDPHGCRRGPRAGVGLR